MSHQGPSTSGGSNSSGQVNEFRQQMALAMASVNPNHAISVGGGGNVVGGGTMHTNPINPGLSVAPLPNHSGGSHSSSSSTSSAHDLNTKTLRQPTDVSRMSHNDLVTRVRKLEADLIKLASDHNHMIREANHRIQGQTVDIAQMRTSITRLEEDNAELRDLCCFLDDDRQKGRKLAREWQRFGRYTASVMRQEVAAYQSKLRELDSKQHRLVTDNQELKELCLYLDEERSQNSCAQCGAAFRRDDGDGSSSGANPIEDYQNTQCNLTNDSTISNHDSSSSSSTQGNLSDREDFTRERNLSSQIVEYVKRLETRVHELEKQETVNCPESVLNALQVLQVCQGLEDNDIGDQEKALVRQMCNVVWKKLEDNPKL